MGDSCAVSAPLLESSQTRIQVDPDEDKSPFRMARDTLFNKLSFALKSKYDIPAAASKGKRTKAEQEYYEKQLATLKSFEEVDSLCEKFQTEELKELEHQEDAQREFGVNIAVNISNIANILLLLFKIYATVETGSIAVAASTLDSLLDLIAGAILWFTNRSMTNTNIYKYPIGKLRVQPVGIIIFAVVMATLGVQILIEAVKQLIDNNPSTKMSHVELEWLYVIMVSAIVVKLALWLYCRKSGSEIVRAYAKDHYFDVVTNVVGLAAAVLGDMFFWWIDPSGAIVLAVYTISVWSVTVFETAASLVGQSAPPEMLQKLTYLVLRHDSVIKRVDTVRAYTFGVLYFVEVDIELPEDLPLKEAHMIGESLQIKIESLEEVERAFVHLDFESEHKPEHSVLAKLPPSQP
uniref:TSA: Wollemia nobilis Ref_Wollemi_Transcript_932_1874 transcribed RNA sequence n=1 Tax=Wollemia nobilis TaxID=56998 RepID=A0A0C9S9F6_9CONI